jgi:acetyl-CoA carboxylase/biotin carboxylase 1
MPQRTPHMISAAVHCCACVLQVEHPVTEGITETNIPSIQLMVGMGIPLWRIPCLRATFNKDPYVSD